MKSFLERERENWSSGCEGCEEGKGVYKGLERERIKERAEERENVIVKC